MNSDQDPHLLPMSESQRCEKLALFVDDVLHAIGIHGEIFDGGERALEIIRSLRNHQYAHKADRSRIRTEFITWINSLPNPATVHHDYFLAQLDRICSAIDTDISPTRTNISSSHTNISPSRVGEFPMITDDRNSEE